MELSNRSVVPLQLVDEDKNFFKQSIDKLALTLQKCDRSYYNIAIIGVQNSGKSTLLNHLFGTNFNVLREMMGTRTTKGILASTDKEKDLLILDVEGNDSHFTHQEYEKIVSSFALIFAHVLLVNVSTKTVGQHTGTQYESLKIIMDICISQFKQESPKVVLFCLRDFIRGQYDEGQLRRKIQTDVRKIWEDIQKPQEIKKYQGNPEKFFIIEVAVLRQFDVDYPEQFIEDVAQLRNRFTDQKSDLYLFKKQNSQNNLPMKDLPFLAQKMWTLLVQNKQLNLPDEKIQLASYRCTQIYTDTCDIFEAKLKEIGTKPVDFGEFSKEVIEQYKTQTYSYGQVAQEKVIELEEYLKNQIQKRVMEIAQLQEDLRLQSYRKNLKEIKYIIQSKSFKFQAKKMMENQTQEQILVFKKMNFQLENRKERIDRLLDKMGKIILEVLQEKQIESKKEFEQTAERDLRLLTAQCLKDNFNQKFWSKVAKEFVKKKKELFQKLQKNIFWLRDHSIGNKQFDEIEGNLVNKTKELIKQDLDSSLVPRIIEYFVINFKRDEQGATHNFSSLNEEKIKQIFAQAKEKTENLLERLDNANFQMEKRSSIQIEDQDLQSCLFFQSTWKLSSKQQIQKKMSQQYENVLRKKNESQNRKVPWYIIILILYFVYDDIWFPAETHPITHYLFTFILVFLGLFIVIGQGSILQQFMNLFVEKTNTKINVIKQKGKQKITELKEKRESLKRVSSDEDKTDDEKQKKFKQI